MIAFQLFDQQSSPLAILAFHCTACCTRVVVELLLNRCQVFWEPSLLEWQLFLPPPVFFQDVPYSPEKKSTGDKNYVKAPRYPLYFPRKLCVIFVLTTFEAAKRVVIFYTSIFSVFFCKTSQEGPSDFHFDSFFLECRVAFFDKKSSLQLKKIPPYLLK